MSYQVIIFLANYTPRELTPCKISHICRCDFNGQRHVGVTIKLLLIYIKRTHNAISKQHIKVLILSLFTDCANKSKPIITGDIPTSSFNATEHQLASYAVPVKLKFSELDAWCIITVLENDTKISQYAQIDLGKNMLVYGAQVRGYVDNLETDTESVNYLAYKFKLDFSVGNKWEKIEGGKVCFFKNKELI